MTLILYLLAAAIVVCRAIAIESFTCMTLLTEVSVGTPSSYSMLQCANSTLQALPNAIVCFPFQEDGDAGAFVDWYSQLIDDFRSSPSNLYTYKTNFFVPTRLAVGAPMDTNSHGYFDSKSAKVMANALLEFVKYANWQRVAILTDMSHRLSLRTMEMFYHSFSSSHELSFTQISHSHTSTLERWFEMILKWKFRVIIVSLPEKLMNSVLCMRSSLGISWPEYAWLVVGFSVDFNQMEVSCKDGAIWFLHHQVEEHTPEKVNIKFDIALQKLADFSSPLLCESNYKPLVIFIYLWQNDEARFVSEYRVSRGLSGVSLADWPQDIVAEPFLYYFRILNMALTVIMFLFITVMLALYVAFRKEIEVKATGVFLNMLVFLGCYLILIYHMALNSELVAKRHVQNAHFDNFICQLQVWFNGCSVPGVLILSVLLVKLARIFRIFNYFQAIKKWSCHDVTLALWAIGLTTPVLLSCTIQSAIYTYQVNITTTMYHGEVLAQYTCLSTRKPFNWIYGHKMYMFAICIVIIVLAIKTRKIKDSNFKDTKKVIVLVIAISILPLLLFGTPYQSEEIQLHPLFVLLLFAGASMLLISLFQLFLIAPKVFPVLKRKILNQIHH